jgi:hypothetical protein
MIKPGSGTLEALECRACTTHSLRVQRRALDPRGDSTVQRHAARCGDSVQKRGGIDAHTEIWPGR